MVNLLEQGLAWLNEARSRHMAGEIEFVLVDPEETIESAFNDVRAAVEKATGFPVHV